MTIEFDPDKPVNWEDIESFRLENNYWVWYTYEDGTVVPFEEDQE